MLLFLLVILDLLLNRFRMVIYWNIYLIKMDIDIFW